MKHAKQWTITQLYIDVYISCNLNTGNFEGGIRSCYTGTFVGEIYAVDKHKIIHDESSYTCHHKPRQVRYPHIVLSLDCTAD